MANMLVVYGPLDKGHIDHNRAKRSSPLCDIALMLSIIGSGNLIKTMMGSYCSRHNRGEAPQEKHHKRN